MSGLQSIICCTLILGSLQPKILYDSWFELNIISSRLHRKGPIRACGTAINGIWLNSKAGMLRTTQDRALQD